ncbi:apoptosis facilitator Bcl-2-like protein 14 [Austrofundulus limnaeus]|uniref:Apoptosis facilitator Bcl-2-like protein 14 n=1 Tax=Austrofundulus limnaeus TaxID=52670 RepID=A0A2I4C123_AUSLI|nr:PREDICTED: apoptosis facilitator Bcl-2-like protein 14 [Austrofundulus limnaeus]
MKDGHVESHGAASNKTTELDSKLDSDPGNMEDSVEYRLMMAYAQRRRPKKEPRTNGHETTPALIKTETDEKQEKKKTKKKKFGTRLLSVFRCVKPQTDESEQPQPAAGRRDVTDRCFVPQHDLFKEDDEEMGELAAQVMGIIEEIELNPSGIESDSKEDDAERIVALLLRDSGDHLQDKFKEANIGLEQFLNYGFFRSVLQTFLERIGFRSHDPNALGPQASPKTQIAMACEVTSRLSAVDTLPEERLLRYGARFLQEDYSAWAEQQGGYEAAFHDEVD